jgi:hypothetical protein
MVKNFKQIRAARIRIRYDSFQIRLRIRQKVSDPTQDPDPQHCLDVSVCLLYSSLYVPGGVGTSPGRICSSAACAMPGGVWPTAASAAPQLSVYKSLSYTWTCLSTFVFTWGVCLQEPVLNLCVSVYKSFFVHLGCQSTRACAALTCVSVYKSFYVQLGCLSTRGCAAPMCVLFVLFLDMSVYKSLCFTCMWMSTRTLYGTSVADLNPGFGAFLTPGSGMCKSQDPDPGSGMNNPDHIS